MWLSGTGDYRSIVTQQEGLGSDGCMICSVAVLAATNSEPYVAVSTLACFFEYQSTSVLLTKWRHPVKDFPVAKQ